MQAKNRIQLPRVQFPIPDPSKDLRTYERMSASLNGVPEMLDRYRSNEGAVGYAALNAGMSCSKASVAYDTIGEKDEADDYRADIENLVQDFQTSMLPDHLGELLGDGLGHALAAVGRNPKLDMIHQERVEAELFSKFFPVIVGESRASEIPELPTVREFGCHVQAVIAAYQDLPLELATRFDEFMVGKNQAIQTCVHAEMYGRFINVARSIYQKLEELNGIPGYVINNSFWRGSGFSNKQFRIKMLLIRQTENQERRLFLMKLASELKMRIQ